MCDDFVFSPSLLGLLTTLTRLSSVESTLHLSGFSSSKLTYSSQLRSAGDDDDVNVVDFIIIFISVLSYDVKKPVCWSRTGHFRGKNSEQLDNVLNGPSCADRDSSCASMASANIQHMRSFQFQLAIDQFSFFSFKFISPLAKMTSLPPFVHASRVAFRGNLLKLQR